MKLFLNLFLILNTSAIISQKYSLSVTATGFPDNVGQAYIGLYRATDDFPVINKQYLGKVVKISGNSASLNFINLSSGNYAVAVFHDRNCNGVLDTNFFGIPTEEYGFSNNARSTFSAPSFSAASVSVTSNKSISISVQ
jgi:uncharacterized protein (DUF2141 family)